MTYLFCSLARFEYEADLVPLMEGGKRTVDEAEVERNAETVGGNRSEVILPCHAHGCLVTGHGNKE